MVQVNRWRFAGCATSFLNANHQPQQDKKHKLYIKFRGLSTKDGYEAFVTDFDGHLWMERLEGSDLQERLKSEASGLEIESDDLINLLDQMCQNISDSSCETSSDMTNLILKTSVKIGFIKLKWTFKTGLCGYRDFNEMIKIDFLLPFFANIRDDKEIKDEIGDKELNAFYETIIPNLIEPTVENVVTFASPTQNSIDSERTLTPPTIETPESPPPLPTIAIPNVVPEEITEEMKRKALEEQLQAAKKKKKKLI